MVRYKLSRTSHLKIFIGTLRKLFRARLIKSKRDNVILIISTLALLSCAGLNRDSRQSGAKPKAIWVPTVGCIGYGVPGSKNEADHGHLSSFRQSGFCLCAPKRIVLARNCSFAPVQIDCRIECGRHQSVTLIEKEQKCPMIHREGLHDRCSLSYMQLDRRATKKFTEIYRAVYKVIIKHALRYKPPGLRTVNSDFVLNNQRMMKRDLQAIRRGLERFVQDAPVYPPDVFAGRGIVLVGGSTKSYATAYWILIHSIRRTNSTLPIEAWFPDDESPNCAQLARLSALNVEVKYFEDLQGVQPKGSGYAFKMLALAYSSFEEVLMLDADVLVLSSPESLFDDAMYRETGILTWKDFWRPSRAPDMEDIITMSHRRDGITAQGHSFTHESGQTLVNKGVVWPAITLALYMNAHWSLFYPLSVNYMGLGDKEILPLAFTFLGLRYGVIETGPDHVGVWSDKAVVFGNTMMQHDSHGEPMFMHANVGKWTDHVPLDFSNYIRRWQVSLKHGSSVVDRINSRAGVDIEKWVHEQLIEHRCIMDSTPPAWYEGLSQGPLLDGMFLTDHFNLNEELDAFDTYRKYLRTDVRGYVVTGLEQQQENSDMKWEKNQHS